MRISFFVPGNPPSVNAYWGAQLMHGHVRFYLTREAKAYKESVKWAALAATSKSTTERGIWFPDQEVALAMTWYRYPRRGDLDNKFKGVLDALEGIAYTNDSQVVELRARRQDAAAAADAGVSIMIWRAL